LFDNRAGKESVGTAAGITSGQLPGSRPPAAVVDLYNEALERFQPQFLVIHKFMIQTLFGSLEQKPGFLDRMKEAVTRTRENLSERIE
jgi:hypothetical protein